MMPGEGWYCWQFGLWFLASKTMKQQIPIVLSQPVCECVTASSRN